MGTFFSTYRNPGRTQKAGLPLTRIALESQRKTGSFSEFEVQGVELWRFGFGLRVRV